MIPKSLPKIINDMMIPTILDTTVLKDKYRITYYRDKFGNIVYQIRDAKTMKVKYILIERP